MDDSNSEKGGVAVLERPPVAADVTTPQEAKQPEPTLESLAKDAPPPSPSEQPAYPQDVRSSRSVSRYEGDLGLQPKGSRMVRVGRFGYGEDWRGEGNTDTSVPEPTAVPETPPAAAEPQETPVPVPEEPKKDRVGLWGTIATIAGLTIGGLIGARDHASVNKVSTDPLKTEPGAHRIETGGMPTANATEFVNTNEIGGAALPPKPEAPANVQLPSMGEGGKADELAQSQAQGESQNFGANVISHTSPTEK